MEKLSVKGTRKGFLGFIKRHKVITALALVVAAVLCVWFFFLRQSAATPAEQPQTIVLAKTDLEQVVSGTGNYRSTASQNVSSSVSYIVKEVFVTAGDIVATGDILARLDTAELDKSIADTKKSLADAEAADARSLAQAERRLQDAKNQYDIDAVPLEAAVADKLSALDAAKFAADAAARAAANSAALISPEKAAVDSADPSALPAALAAYSALWATDSGSSWLSVFNSTYTADASVPAAQAAYNAAVSARDKALRNDSLAIENARDSITNLKTSAESYRNTLKTQQDTRNKCMIKAPASGTVTAVNAKVGNSAGGGTAASGTALFVIEDAQSLEIAISVAEYDVVNLSVGMSATLTTDALDGEEWLGTVNAISPAAIDTSGNFTATVRVMSPVGNIRIGMSGKVNIQVAAKQNVFAVPYDAVTTDSSGDKVIYVLDESAIGAAVPGDGISSQRSFSPGGTQGAPNRQSGSGIGNIIGSRIPGGAPGNFAATMGRRAIKVKTGMETDYYIEIIGDDLKEGLIVLSDPESKNVSTGNSGGMSVVGGGGMRF